ncbi:hypothetical protein [Nocardia sp.]|uniref:hypothetical protein n=1 Tax=Nocardia sp. TaxID=1821 RepID=UPI003F8E9C34
MATAGLAEPRRQDRTRPAKPSQPPDDESGTADDESDPSPPVDDADAAADLIRRKIRALPPNLDRDKATRRLVALLARRGYSPSTAYSVVKQELAAANYF